jgi:hypothetical protein
MHFCKKLEQQVLVVGMVLCLIQHNSHSCELDSLSKHCIVVENILVELVCTEFLVVHSLLIFCSLNMS